MATDETPKKRRRKKKAEDLHPSRIENFAVVTETATTSKAVFPTLAAYYACANAENETATGEFSRTSRSIRSAEWAGTDSYTEAKALMLDGWTEGLGKIREAMAGMESTIRPLMLDAQKNRMKPYKSVAGTAPDVQRYLSGHPKSMTAYKRKSTIRKRPTVRLLCRTLHSHFVTSEQIINRGAAIVAIVEILEHAGVAVEVVAGSAEGLNRYKTSAVWPVKLAGERLDTAQLAYNLAHPASGRRTCFAVMEQRSEEWRRKMAVTDPGSYGRPGNLEQPDDREGWNLQFAAAINPGEFSSPNSTAKAIKSFMEEFTRQQQKS